MFQSTRPIIAVPGFLMMGITLFAGFQLTVPMQRNPQFWYTLTALMLAEGLLMLTIVDIGGNHRDRAMPYRWGNIIIAFTYFLFTLTAILLYINQVSVNTILLTQMIGLFVAILMHILFGLAHHATAMQAMEFQEKRQNKKNFKTALKSAQIDLHPILSANRNIAEHFSQLIDLVRFASESSNDTDTGDSVISQEIQNLETAIRNQPTQEIDRQILQLISLFQKRQIRIKESR